MEIKLKLECPNCGGVQFKAASPKPGPKDPLTCAACGTIVRQDEVKARLEREARAAVEERLRKK